MYSERNCPRRAAPSPWRAPRRASLPPLPVPAKRFRGRPLSSRSDQPTTCTSRCTQSFEMLSTLDFETLSTRRILIDVIQPAAGSRRSARNVRVSRVRLLAVQLYVDNCRRHSGCVALDDCRAGRERGLVHLASIVHRSSKCVLACVAESFGRRCGSGVVGLRAGR
eukprot:COSAG02_NODE_1947_length_10299_cov_21.930294_5_plen_166_part_00